MQLKPARIMKFDTSSEVALTNGKCTEIIMAHDDHELLLGF
jgi:hypothetical protein